jgi:hypothetical protein
LTKAKHNPAISIQPIATPPKTSLILSASIVFL